MNTKISSYEQQAIDFLKANDIKFKATFIRRGKHLPDDKDVRNVYNCDLVKGKFVVSFEFGQSVVKSAQWAKDAIKPTAYDLLSCITKNDPGEFEDFCAECGYDTDSRKAYSMWESVCEEWAKVSDFFTPEEMEQLQEIQ